MDVVKNLNCQDVTNLMPKVDYKITNLMPNNSMDVVKNLRCQVLGLSRCFQDHNFNAKGRATLSSNHQIIYWFYLISLLFYLLFIYYLFYFLLFIYFIYSCIS